MSDEPSERDDGPYKGWSIAAIIHNYVVIRGDLSEQYARDQLVDLLAERIAQARREGAAEALRQATSELDALPSYRFEGGEDHYGDDRIHAYGRDEEAERIAQWLRSRAAARMETTP